LIDILEKVVLHYDCTVLCGARTTEEQRLLVNAGKSRTMNSKHLVQDTGYAHAVDISPYPIPDNWGENNNLEKAKFYHFAGYMQSKFDELEVNAKLRWGGDWDSDRDFDDQTFMDLVHFELVGISK